MEILADALALLSDAVNKAVILIKAEIDATVATIKADLTALDARILDTMTNAVLPFREELNATMADIKANVSGLDKAVDTLTNKVSSSYGHITMDDKTAAPAMCLDILEARIMTQQPTDLPGAFPHGTTPSRSPAVLAADNPVDAQPADIMANSRVAYATLHERHAAGAAFGSHTPSAPTPPDQRVTPYPPSRCPPPLHQTTIPESFGRGAGPNEATPEPPGCGAGPNPTGEDTSMVLGGAIVSPCHIDRAMHA
jgi:hypothetical protein